MKFTRCSYCDNRIYIWSNVFEFNKELFCTEGCAREYADNRITEGILEESDCDMEDDAE
jgi:hypothetical protein